RTPVARASRAGPSSALGPGLRPPRRGIAQAAPPRRSGAAGDRTLHRTGRQPHRTARGAAASRGGWRHRTRRRPAPPADRPALGPPAVVSRAAGGNAAGPRPAEGEGGAYGDDRGDELEPSPPRVARQHGSAPV